MIKMIVQQKKTSRHIDDIKSRNLSIQFSLDGFSFCISNQKNEAFYLKNFVFDKTVSVEDCLTDIVSVFKTEEELQHDFDSVTAIHQNYLNTIVPDELFDEQELASYLKFNVKTLATDAFDFDEINGMNAKNVYVPYTNINNFIFQNFGAFEFKHHLTVLIEKLRAKNEGTTIYLHVAKNHLDIIVYQDTSLLLSNSFAFDSKKDLIYYVLFTSEQLKLDPETMKLVLLGAIDKDSENYNILYTYIRNISFIDSNHPLLDRSTDFLNHSNYILLG